LPYKNRKVNRAHYMMLHQQRRILMDFLKEEPCVDCGHCFPAECMHFDHVRGIKQFSLSSSTRYSPKKTASELDKCDLVCANCHSIRTRKRRNLRWR
jgi:hypothetical protein